MAVLVECICHRVQSLKNKKCALCGGDLAKLKKAGRAAYWIAYRLPGGKQRRERIGLSVEEARDADGKRRVQKRERRIFDILPDAEMTFKELAKWYLEARAEEELKSIKDVEDDLNNFNAVYGARIVGDLHLEDLVKYQNARKKQGRALATIDQELVNVKAMMNRAFDNDLVSGHVLKPFRRVKRLLRAGGNARTRTITLDEYERLLQGAPPHLRGMIITAFSTGMRLGEILKLKWSQVDRKEMFIRLDGGSTKEGRPKSIPINRHVATVLASQIRAINHDYVFLYNGKPIRSKCGIRRSLETACKKANIAFGRKADGGITFHDIRRTVKTLMVEAGIDKAYRDTILGHSLRGMDARYIVPSDEALRVAMERYTAFMDARIEEMKAGEKANVD